MSHFGGDMTHSSQTRRDFIATTSVGLIGAAALPIDQAPSQEPSTPPAGAPPAFGAGPAVGPPVSASTFAEAERLVQFELTPSERAVAADSWRSNLAAVYERRVGPRKVPIDSKTAPYSQWYAVLPGQLYGPGHEDFVRSSADPDRFPEKDDDIAYSPVT